MQLSKFKNIFLFWRIFVHNVIFSFPGFLVSSFLVFVCVCVFSACDFFSRDSFMFWDNDPTFSLMCVKSWVFFGLKVGTWCGWYFFPQENLQRNLAWVFCVFNFLEKCVHGLVEDFVVDNRCFVELGSPKYVATLTKMIYNWVKNRNYFANSVMESRNEFGASLIENITFNIFAPPKIWIL